MKKTDGNSKFPTKDRFFIEIYCEAPGEANILHVINEDEYENNYGTSPTCHVLMRSKKLIQNLEENTQVVKGAKEPLIEGEPVIIDGFEFYKDPLESKHSTGPLNEEGVEVWLRRPLTEKELQMISPFLI